MRVQGPGRQVPHSSVALGSSLHCCGCPHDSITQSVVHYCLSQLRPWKLSSCKWKGAGAGGAGWPMVQGQGDCFDQWNLVWFGQDIIEGRKEPQLVPVCALHPVLGYSP